MPFPRWFVVCKVCKTEFYTNLRGPAAKVILPIPMTCPQGHVEPYTGSELLLRIQEEKESG